MQAGAVSSFADVAGLARLRVRAASEDPAALQEAATQFEALVIGMMLEQARAATGEGIFDGPETAQYLEMLDQQVALDMARKGGFGLAAWLTSSMERPPGPRNAPSRPEGGPAPIEARPVTERAATRVPTTPSEFVREVLPHATHAARRLGVDPKVLIAQAALESGWGRAVPAFPDGRSSHNYFGIKATAGWAGDKLARPTLEFSAGVASRRVEQFRAYPDAASAFDDYVRLVKDSPRYGQAVAHGTDPAAYVAAIAGGGYATDPDYAKKWTAVLGSDALVEAFETQGPAFAADKGWNMEVSAVMR